MRHKEKDDTFLDFDGSYPEGVPHRIPRKRRYVVFSSARDCRTESIPLDSAIQDALKQMTGIEYINFYRQGAFCIEVLFSTSGYRLGGGFWTVRSEVPEAFQKGHVWTAESLEDWLYGDLVFVQMPKKIEAIQKNDNQVDPLKERNLIVGQEKYKIEKSVPLPSPNEKISYPFKQMEVGDSFFVPEEKVGSMRQCLWKNRLRLGFSFVTRKENGGVRVWRTK